MNGSQPSGPVTPFGGSGNRQVEQFQLNQFRNQNTFNTSSILNTNRINNMNNMPNSIHNNSNGNSNHLNPSTFGLHLNGGNNTSNNNNNSNHNGPTNNPLQIQHQHQQQQQQQNNTINNTINTINNINNMNNGINNINNANNLLDSLINNNNNNNQNNNNSNNNNTQNHNGFSMNNIDQSQIQNPLNSAMSSADVETILHLQKQTDEFHQHLSNFINTHLPELPDTMQLMDQLSYDFNNNSNNNNNNNTNNNQRERDINMNDNSESNVPSLDTDNKEDNNNNNNSSNNSSKLRQQLTALSMQCSTYKKQFESANNDLLNWKQECIKLREENNKFKNKINLLENKLIGTRNVALNGGGPRLDNISFLKSEQSLNGSYSMTIGVNKLKKSVRKNYDTSKWKIEGDEDLYEYFDSILAFLNENEENVVEPQILFPKNNRMNIDNNNNNNEEDSPYFFLKQSSVIEKYYIANHLRIPILNGQYGIRAKMDIPKHTVIGQYIGVEYLESEFHKAYSGTQENAMKNIYAFTLAVGGDKKNNISNKGKIVIDAFGFEIDKNHNKPLLIFINDCRKDISVQNKTLDDEKEENCQFAKVSLNGWPSLFVITKRKIKKNEELFVYYGNDYFHALKEKELQQQIRNRNQNIIDHNIIQGQINVNNRHVNLV